MAADFQELVFAVRIDQQPFAFHQLSVRQTLAGTTCAATVADLGQAALAMALRDFVLMRLPLAPLRLLALLLGCVCGCCVWEGLGSEASGNKWCNKSWILATALSSEAGGRKRGSG